jgi:hypothetical protein
LDEEYIRLQAIAKQQTQQIYNSSLPPQNQHVIRNVKRNSSGTKGILQQIQTPEACIEASTATMSVSPSQIATSSLSSPLNDAAVSKPQTRASSRNRKRKSSPPKKDNLGEESANMTGQKQFQYHPYNPNKENMHESGKNSTNNVSPSL